MTTCLTIYSITNSEYQKIRKKSLQHFGTFHIFFFHYLLEVCFKSLFACPPWLSTELYYLHLRFIKKFKNNKKVCWFTMSRLRVRKTIQKLPAVRKYAYLPNRINTRSCTAKLYRNFELCLKLFLRYSFKCFIHFFVYLIRYTLFLLRCAKLFSFYKV